MDGWLKQSTAITLRIGPFLDDADGKTPKTNLTITQGDVRLSKAGGAFAQKNDTNGCTHDENGYYSCSLNANDTNTLGLLKLAVLESGALPVWHTFMVVTANFWDAMFGSGDLAVNTTKIGGTTQTARDIGASVLLSPGTGTGQVNLSNGRVGINWGDVINPTSTVGLTNTTISSSQTVASVSGSVNSVTTGVTLATNAVSSTTIADNAITAAKIATGAITNTKFASGAIDASAIATDAITSAKIAADAIGASEFAQAAADKVWSSATRSLTDKSDFALSSASRAAIWDEGGSLSISFEVLVERIYQIINNKMIITESTGNVALRNLADSADIATGNVQDLGATTQRNALTWV